MDTVSKQCFIQKQTLSASEAIFLSFSFPKGELFFTFRCQTANSGYFVIAHHGWELAHEPWWARAK